MAKKKQEVMPSISSDESLTLRLMYSELEKANLKVQLAQQAVQIAQSAANQANKVMSDYVSGLNEKYDLNPDRDSIDLATGLINREEL